MMRMQAAHACDRMHLTHIDGPHLCLSTQRLTRTALTVHDLKPSQIWALCAKHTWSDPSDVRVTY